MYRQHCVAGDINFSIDLDHQLSESRLLTLLRLAVKDTERVWELTLSNTITAMDTQQLLEEHLCDMGLLQEGVVGGAKRLLIHVW